MALLAARQQGSVSRAQLLELGVNDRDIARRVAGGRWFREHQGVFSIGRPAVTPPERASAAVLACGRGAALSCASAMVLWGYWRRWEEPLEVVVARHQRPPGIRTHRFKTLAWRDLTTQYGIRVTSPARTLFDIAPRVGDEVLLRAAGRALHSSWLTQGQLEEFLDRHRRYPSARRIARLLDIHGSEVRADWEARFPQFCAKHGLPDPDIGAHVAGYIVDALLPGGVIVEMDSWEFHGDRAAFEGDRDRDADTLAAGYVTVRITWRRQYGAPKREAERLKRIVHLRLQQAA